MAYQPQMQQPYPQYANGHAYPGGYPQPNYYPQPQPQVIYQEQSRSRFDDPNTSWLLSIFALCCGCLLGEALCDEQCCCCLIPCALPRFR